MKKIPEICAPFADALRGSGKSRATIHQYAREAEALCAFAAGRPMTRALLAAYRDALTERHKPQTVNVKLSAINAYLKFIGRTDCCQRLLPVQRRAFIDDSRELTREEYARLLAAAQDRRNERLSLVMQTLCATGMRVSELRAMTVEAAKQGRAEIALKGKLRVVLLPKKLRAELLAYAKRRGIRAGCVFVTRSGHPLDRSNIWRDMKRLCAQAHVCRSKVFPHNLRHLFARSYYAVEKNLAHLADILGHSSVETTRIYVAASCREHERTLNRMRLLI